MSVNTRKATPRWGLIAPPVPCLLKLLLLISKVACADIGTDGLCTLFSYVGFTLDGGEPCPNCTGLPCDCTDFGFNQMASVFLAMEHFNARNASVVPELNELGDCNIKFDMENSRIINADALTHDALNSLINETDRPCAAVGPFDDLPAAEVSTMAAAFRFPVTTYRGFNIRLLSEFSAPYTTQMYPDMIITAETVGWVLLQRNRTDYVAFLYPLTETGTQWREAVSAVLDEHEVENQAFGFNSRQSPVTSSARTMRKALEGVRDSGYRTIVVSAEVYFEEIPLMAQHAVDLGLANGDYMWVFMGMFDPSLWLNTDPDMAQLTTGSILPMPLEEQYLNISHPFVLAWKSQGVEAVNRLNAANPIERGDRTTEINHTGYTTTGTPGYVFAQDDFFAKSYPEFGSGFLYDSVIATGMGACRAQASSDGSNVEVEEFVKGIRESNFSGASGHVSVGCPGCSLNQARTPYSNTWGVMNIFPPTLYATEVIYEGVPIFLNETIYADGRSVPPDLLIKEPDQNYLSKWARIVGLALLSVAWLISVITVIWVYVHRDHHVLKAAQPHFLYLICFGACVSVSAIFSLSFDENVGWSIERLTHACMSIPWLVSLGHIITYGALFSKLWRINKVLQPTRRKIDMKQVLWPSLILVAATVVVLGLWTGLDPLMWIRDEINPISRATIGQCTSENVAAFVVPLIIVLLIPTVLTLYMAWCTRDINEAYSESYWIFIMVLVQCEVILFAVPMFALLRDVSTDGRYLGYVFLIWTFPMSALGLIIGPKVVAFRRAMRGNDGRQQRRGFTGVHVTGLSIPPALVQSVTTTCSKNSSDLSVQNRDVPSNAHNDVAESPARE